MLISSFSSAYFSIVCFIHKVHVLLYSMTLNLTCFLMICTVKIFELGQHLCCVSEDRWVVLSLSDFSTGQTGDRSMGLCLCQVDLFRASAASRPLGYPPVPVSHSEWHRSVQLKHKVRPDVYIVLSWQWQRLAAVFVSCPLLLTLSRWMQANLCSQISFVQKWKLIESLPANSKQDCLCKLAYFVKPCPNNLSILSLSLFLNLKTLSLVLFKNCMLSFLRCHRMCWCSF